MSNNGPKPLKTAQKAIILHTLGVRVVKSLREVLSCGECDVPEMQVAAKAGGLWRSAVDGSSSGLIHDQAAKTTEKKATPNEYSVPSTPTMHVHI